MLVGRTGVGKSTTVNRLMGEEVAPVGAFERTSQDVRSYQNGNMSIPIIVVDTPGLGDTEGLEKDQEYFNDIRAKVSSVDCLLFVTRLDDTRVSRDEKLGIKGLSETFGEGVWDVAVIVFTFAGRIGAPTFQETLNQRRRLIRSEIASRVGEKVAERIPAVAGREYRGGHARRKPVAT